MSARPQDSAPTRLPAAGLALVAFTFLALTALSWRAWADVFVDFGRELYLPWRVSQGEVLYRDLAAFNGPLSVYWNALWMRAFGGYTGILVSNLLILAGFTWLLLRSLARLGNALAAIAGTLFFLLVFAFGQTSGVGNYEFPSPYAHEATHGLVLSALALAVLLGGERSRARTLGAGLLLGLVFLTKLELFVAAAGALALGAVLRARSDEEPAAGGRAGSSSIVDVATLLAAALVPVVTAALLLATAMPLGEAFAGLTEGLRGALGPAAALEYYRGDLGLGLATPWKNLGFMGLGTLAFLALVVLAALGEKRWRTPPNGMLAAVFAGLSALLLFLPHTSLGYWVGRPLPALMLLFLAALLVRWRRAPRGPERRLLAARASVTAFALLCLGKMLLAARLWHYGFVLAVPASLVCVLYGLAWLPERWRARGSSGRLASVLFLALFARVAWIYAQESLSSYQRRSVPVANGADRIVADGRGVFADEALLAIEALLPPDATLLVLPEGVSINYLARRRVPTRYVNYMPPELALYGEDTILAALEASPPDAVLLVHKRTPEYGLPLFGQDFGRALLAWVREHYQPAWSYGDPPLEPEARMGVALLLPR